MKTAAFIILGTVMGIGGYVLMQATLAGQAAEAEQAAHERHCQAVNLQVITEFDAIVAERKFPTQAQQDYWRQITSECQEDVKP